MRMLMALIVWSAATASSPAFARDLSFDDRVAAQKAIEQVYWNHRTWPKDNPGPKPPLSVVMPDAAIRAKVDDYLRKSTALEKYWQRPITGRQLQAEIDRIARASKAPEMLREMFGALGNDPVLIAETLGRQKLAERLIREWYARDARFHADVRVRAEAALRKGVSPAKLREIGAEFGEARWVRGTQIAWDRSRTLPGASIGTEPPVALEGSEWDEAIAKLAGRFGVIPAKGKTDPFAALPIGTVSPLREEADRFVVTSVVSKGNAELTIAETSWPKRRFDAWWAAEHSELPTHVVGPTWLYRLPRITVTTCQPDTWAPTRGSEVPDPRYGHTAVWTGSEMIVWGGGGYNTGGRYDPVSDSWTTTSTGTNVPTPRSDHTVVWTGSEMIVWGGSDSVGGLNTGGRYDPVSDSWAPTSTGANVPSPRSTHTAVWTGSEMIVWGGFDGSPVVNSGGRYDPVSDSWTATSVGANVPAPRSDHTAVWTGSQMIVFGGTAQDELSVLNTAGRYDPISDSWESTSTGANVPAPRSDHSAVWTGSEMIVWGGYDGNLYLNTGGRYNPVSDSWTPTSTSSNVPSASAGHTAVWTGSEMIVWGGANGNTGGRYDPASDTWTPTSTGANVPSARADHTAVWTGSEMIVWGGSPGLNTGGLYDPVSNSWIPTSTGASVPSPRSIHTAVWTGSEMIVWGGFEGSPFVPTGGRYDPSTDSWTPTSTGANVPSAGVDHATVWTGSEMIVWGVGGEDDGKGGYVGTGARYDPVFDRWIPTSTLGAPSERSYSTAVWTGSEMIVWGGFPSFAGGPTNTGGRYNPVSNSWSPTSTGANVPAGRYFHEAVWTGMEMIAWGGLGDGNSLLNSGGRYDPTTDGWTTTSTGANVPAQRYGHTAVWTGTEMIVWGGHGSGNLHTGGRYDPTTDSWTATATGANVPAPRSGHTAVWTGSEMIVWGGGSNTGGRYEPAADEWTPTSADEGVPSPRSGHTAVSTGTEMIVWGGFSGSVAGATSSGGRYCAGGCSNPTISYRDFDSDGFGDSSFSTTTCDGSIPDGYVSDHADCDDSSAGVNPGATEVCNGTDDNCDGRVDEDGNALCDDNEACTDDICHGAAGCSNSLNDDDGDGVCDANDHCPATIVTPTVVIDGCDSGVGNHLFQGGCNFGDVIAGCRSNAKNHGQFVSCVAHAVNTWKSGGLITGQQGSRITRCAAR